MVCVLQVPKAQDEEDIEKRALVDLTEDGGVQASDSSRGLKRVPKKTRLSLNFFVFDMVVVF